MSKLAIGKIEQLSVGSGIGHEPGRIGIKPGYSLIPSGELAELQATREDLDWLLNYLNDNVPFYALTDFWEAATEFCEGAEECLDPMICGQQAIRKMRGVK